MDRRARELERRWQASGDPNIHAALLTHLLRTGEFKESALICAAYLGHPGAKLAVPHAVKPTGVIFKDRLLKNEEIRDYIYWLWVFGMRITHRAGLGLIKLAHQHSMEGELHNVVDKAKAAVELETQKARQQLRRAVRDTRWDRAFSYRSRQYNLYRWGCRIADDLAAKKSPVRPMQSLSGYMKDSMVKKAIRGEIYPFLLGDYR